jgi:outer membrane protein assembly factor BamE (lipoprotein component of BamABCDE complex)
MGPGGTWRQILLEFVGMAALVILSGCSTPPVSDGRLAPTENLGKLTVGASSQGDVRAALGTPRGYGALRHGQDQPDLRKIWYYEFVQIKGDQVGLKILLVFFHQEKFDGYVWFGAKELLDRGVL